jgi:hypothetical protein
MWMMEKNAVASYTRQECLQATIFTFRFPLMARKIFLFVGIASVIILGIAIFLPSTRERDAEVLRDDPPDVQLELFMTDKMDYGIRFSRLLAEKRIAMARRFAAEDPALAARAREVIDSLEARLSRSAKM